MKRVSAHRLYSVCSSHKVEMFKTAGKKSETFLMKVITSQDFGQGDENMAVSAK